LDKKPEELTLDDFYSLESERTANVTAKLSAIMSNKMQEEHDKIEKKLAKKGK